MKDIILPQPELNREFPLMKCSCSIFPYTMSARLEEVFMCVYLVIFFDSNYIV
jgi:hypothetical protein